MYGDRISLGKRSIESPFLFFRVHLHPHHHHSHLQWKLWDKRQWGGEGVLDTDTYMWQLRPGNNATFVTKVEGISDVRRVNPGVNPITASVRDTYGTVHQVVV